MFEYARCLGQVSRPLITIGFGSRQLAQSAGYAWVGRSISGSDFARYALSRGEVDLGSVSLLGRSGPVRTQVKSCDTAMLGRGLLQLAAGPRRSTLTIPPTVTVALVHAACSSSV